jgi:RNA polymerase sigma-70 factor, ECF subfamily
MAFVTGNEATAVNSSITAGFPSLPMSPKAVKNASVTTGVMAPPTELSDEALLDKICAGEEDALGVLFRRYARLVRSVGQRILRDNGEADDLVQEVFLYIHRKSILFDSSKGPARSWIVQVAYTQALIRRRKLKSRGFYASGITDRTVEIGLSSANGAHYDNTVEGFFGRNGWKKIWDSLTEHQQETFRLHFFEGCTFTEVAEKLGQSYVSIRHHYYRGLDKLRKHADENDLNWP